MTHLSVDRSVSRQLLLMLAGFVLVLTAIDVMWVHQVSGPPETNDDGTLSSRGNAQRRQDILWSSVFLVSGTATAAFGAIGLARRRGLFELTDIGVRARVMSTNGYLELPWSEVLAVRSGVDDSGNELDEPLLIITVADPLVYPHNLWGAEWRGSDLRINTGPWATPVEEVVVRASLVSARFPEPVDEPTTESLDDDEPDEVPVPTDGSA